uniref:Uncharacterized protein n=1 Tax=Acrobeloides nanus TaxID=290746 RepID=A0A914BXM3_9BILA
MFRRKTTHSKSQARSRSRKPAKRVTSKQPKRNSRSSIRSGSTFSPTSRSLPKSSAIRGRASTSKSPVTRGRASTPKHPATRRASTSKNPVPHGRTSTPKPTATRGQSSSSGARAKPTLPKQTDYQLAARPSDDGRGHVFELDWNVNVHLNDAHPEPTNENAMATVPMPQPNGSQGTSLAGPSAVLYSNPPNLDGCTSEESDE